MIKWALVCKMIKKERIKEGTKISKESNEEEHKVFLPCIQGTMESITRILKKKNIKTVFSPPNKLEKFPSKVKDPISPGSHKGVYSIPYSCGKA